MDEQDAGGPAFPLPYESNDVLPFYRGMTLRDYFAAKWMQAYVANPATADITEAELAQYSYEIADAMLKVREQ